MSCGDFAYDIPFNIRLIAYFLLCHLPFLHSFPGCIFKKEKFVGCVVRVKKKTTNNLDSWLFLMRMVSLGELEFKGVKQKD